MTTNSIYNNIDGFILDYQSKYGAAILALTKEQFNEEDLTGKSFKQYEVNYYWLALGYALVIYIEWMQGLNNDWDYYKEKYDIDCITKSLACKGINFTTILADIGLPNDTIYGKIIEETFIIEDEVEDEYTEFADISELVELIDTTVIVNTVI